MLLNIYKLQNLCQRSILFTSRIQTLQKLILA